MQDAGLLVEWYTHTLSLVDVGNLTQRARLAPSLDGQSKQDEQDKRQIACVRIYIHEIHEIPTKETNKSDKQKVAQHARQKKRNY